MNPDFDDPQLESEIDRQLKDLPELIAPRSLVPRTMQLIAQLAAVWQSRSWSTWPMSIRAAFIVVSVALLAATVPGLRAFEQNLLVPMFAKLNHWGASSEWIWNAATALASAGTAIVNHASKGIIFSCVLAIVLAYAACIGFGTVFVKLALSDAKKN
ncbi:MAG TPA: hypothetical protein VGO67_02595 [Verrucomicrobiae bacterium]|jgi:hypothetical protein